MRRFRFGLPALGALAAGLGALVFIVVGTRSLGLERFAAIGQLWTIWAIAYSVVTFSVQQVTIRSLARGAGIPWRQSTLPALAMAVVAAPILFIWRERLFASGSLAWPVIGTIIPFGSLLTGIARGRLAAVGDNVGLLLAVGGENTIRAMLGLVLATIGAGPSWFAGAIVAGFLAAASGLRRVGAAAPPAAAALLEAQESPFLGVANSVAGLCSHSILVVAPAALALASVPPTVVSAVFVVLALYRSPYQLVLGVAPSLSNDFINRLPRLSLAERRRHLRRFVSVGVLLAGVGASGAALLGERIVSPVFGAQGVLSAGDHALAAGLTMLAVVSITLTMAVTGLNDPKTLVTVWPVAAVLGIGTIVVGGLGPSAALVSLVSAESIVVVGLAASLWYRMDGSSGEREMALGFPRG